MKFLFRLFLGAIIIFIIIIGICAMILYMGFSRTPFSIVLNQSPISSIISLKGKIDKESKFIFSEKPGDERKLILSADEINSAFNLYLSASQFNSMVGKKNLISDSSTQLKGGNFDNGRFTLYLSHELSFDNPFGNYANIVIEAVPDIEDKHLDMKIHSLKAGSIPIPSFAIKYLMEEKNDKINNIKEVKLLLKAIKKLEVNKDSLIIIYNPVELSNLLHLYSDKLKP